MKVQNWFFGVLAILSQFPFFFSFLKIFQNCKRIFEYHMQKKKKTLKKKHKNALVGIQ